ncbi:hypothetical protein [Xanthomonas translucens]|uniref:hypothetical protein n=1 Tax=Xanthomonas campestris pv. translucens TaxID=343 RepID=UPI00071B46FC|nr:hypothetical protein [Xanthomonas translucens]AVY67162.1 hypothetical protein NZ30_12765 [Xanthomonas translucens pv. undulosa]MCT8281750.1 hypothetical protein [Xanthomonas translucens pv. undulosa]MCT8316496.1 hypothetical protein [Xanthomonas translucens pv. undulosa]QEN93647.1 hypothetical protein F0H33_09890 [Xanthomonas translucens pv. undulosa]QSQ58038.1 hypothetical protein ISN37_08930 [Xanthomonas translucens pv. undulosa]
MAEAQTNSGSKLYICVTPKNDDLTATQFAALTWVLVNKVGNVGERGTDTNIVSWDSWDTEVTSKGKGITNAGDPEIEVAELLADPGQIAMRTAGAPGVPDNYAFKIERPDGTMEYLRGLVAGPKFNGGRNEDFVLNTYKLGLNQVPIRVEAPAKQ